MPGCKSVTQLINQPDFESNIMAKFITPFDRKPGGISGLTTALAASFEVERGSLRVEAEEKHRSAINGASFGIGTVRGEGAMKVSTSGHLFVLVERGLLIAESGEEVFYFHPGQSFVAPQGSKFILRQECDVDFAFGSCIDEPRPGQIIPICGQGGRMISAPYSAELLLSEHPPQQASKTFFSDTSGRWQVGIWSSESFERKPVAFPKDELMYIHSGKVELRTEDGEGDTVDAGVPFLLSHKKYCKWKNEGFIDKTYCVVIGT